MERDMTHEVTVKEAAALTADLLCAAGVGEVEATRTAQALVLAELWGIPSHGLMRLPYYLDRLAAGGCNPAASLTSTTDTGPLVALDGNDGLGHWQMWHAAELARDRCAQYGIAAVAVSRSSHCGALGVYTLPGLGAGQITLVFSNGPAVMPPWGGREPLLSTSPIAAGIPCAPRPAIIDLATSVVARGKIAGYARRGEPLEAGWAFTRDGEPTTDAAQALQGMLAPLGGAKGYALAFMVEALTGGLVGPLLSVDVPDMLDVDHVAQQQRIGHLVLAINPAAVGSGAQVRLADLAERAAAAGGRVPGSARALPEHLADDKTITVAEATWTAVRSHATATGGRAAGGHSPER